MGAVGGECLVRVVVDQRSRPDASVGHQVDSAKVMVGRPHGAPVPRTVTWGMATPQPILDRGDLIALRDPALVVHDGLCHCFHTVARPAGPAYSLGIDVAVTGHLHGDVCCSALKGGRPG